jgi:hypothetical protein
MQKASLTDADHRNKLILQSKLGCVLTNEEFIECRQSLIYIGRAIAKWHQISYGKEKS